MSRRTLPELRPVEVFPVKDDNETVYVVKDPEGIQDEPLFLTPLAGWLMQFFNGQTTPAEVNERAHKEIGQQIPDQVFEELTDTLDKRYLLDNERYRNKFNDLKETYLQQAERPATLPGDSLPNDPDKTRTFFEQLFEAPGEIDSNPGDILGFILPHIDFERGRRTYQESIPFIQSLDSPRRFVVLGISHNHSPVPFATSRKDYGTALGTVPIDRDAVRDLNNQLDYDGDDGELAHRNEHSVEIPLTLLQYVLPDVEFSVVPVICSYRSDSQYPELPEQLIPVLEDLLEEPHTYLIGGVDFAHVGPQFGDRSPLGSEDFESIQSRDQQMMSTIKSGDEKQFERHIQSDDNGRRVCGYPALRSLLPLVDEAEEIHYDMWDDPSGTVSYGSLLLK